MLLPLFAALRHQPCRRSSVSRRVPNSAARNDRGPRCKRKTERIKGGTRPFSGIHHDDGLSLQSQREGPRQREFPRIDASVEQVGKDERDL
jgi:hypothetical protein